MDKDKFEIAKTDRRAMGWSSYDGAFTVGPAVRG